jgi:hypothetical protein
MVREPVNFLCPECGGTEIANQLSVETAYDPKVPWSHVLRVLICRSCRFEIPAHRGERWNDLGVEDARREWREIYRKDANRERRRR